MTIELTRNSDVPADFRLQVDNRDYRSFYGAEPRLRNRRREREDTRRIFWALGNQPRALELTAEVLRFRNRFFGEEGIDESCR